MIKLMETPMLALQVRRAAEDLGDVIYVHGSTFGADLSVFYSVDGRSWADELNAAGFNVWGFDFAGYGASERYPQHDGIPAGAYMPAAASTASHYPLTVWAQYRRFVEDVPGGQPQLLDEAHFQHWSAAFLASDPEAATRMPPAVLTPAGPQIDVRALWAGHALYDAARVTMPTLLVRGEWDSVCAEADANHLLSALGGGIRVCKTIPRATHLMHLESSRGLLYNAVNSFLLRIAK